MTLSNTGGSPHGEVTLWGPAGTEYENDICEFTTGFSYKERGYGGHSEVAGMLATRQEAVEVFREVFRGEDEDIKPFLQLITDVVGEAKVENNTPNTYGYQAIKKGSTYTLEIEIRNTGKTLPLPYLFRRREEVEAIGDVVKNIYLARRREIEDSRPKVPAKKINPVIDDMLENLKSILG